MAVLFALLGLAFSQTAPDPDLLPIGRSGTAQVGPGQIYDLRHNKLSSINDLVSQAGGLRFVYLGEQHATTAHQQMEAQVIRALQTAGRSVDVGMEMYTRPKQDVLDQWSAGKLTEDQFLEQSDWKHQWGYDYGFYRPVFEAVRELKLPLVGLNVPRDWVHQVGTSGYAGLSTSARLQLPAELYLGNGSHRQVFNAMMGGHPMAGINFDDMYAAQVLWDEGMSDTALKYLERFPATPKTAFVVICGAGHLMYGQGINYRVERRHGGKGLTLIMIQSDKPVQVARGIGDFIYVSPPDK